MDGRLARVCAALGIVAAVTVPLLLLATWGHVYTPGYGSRIRAFHGGDFPAGVRIGLFLLSAGVVIAGIVAFARPLRYPVLLMAACLAMAAEVGLIVVELNSNSLFYPEAWRFATSTVVIAFAVSGVWAALWFALFWAAIRGKQCEDCAERVRRSAVDCPHCGYQFPLSGHMKRCEACRRPIKA
jgi:hypothetical protein